MPANPITLVIFGASGDLTARKLIPSLYNLDRKRRLPDDLRIVGVSRTPFSDAAFRAKLAPAAKEFVKGEWSAESWDRFARRVHYIAGDASLFMGAAEIERAWEILDPLIAVAEKTEEYAVGGSGAKGADAYLARSGRSWLSLCGCG